MITYFKTRRPDRALGGELAKICRHFKRLTGVDLRDYCKAFRALVTTDEYCHRVRLESRVYLVGVKMEDTYEFPLNFTPHLAQMGALVRLYIKKVLTLKYAPTCDPLTGKRKMIPSTAILEDRGRDEQRIATMLRFMSSMLHGPNVQPVKVVHADTGRLASRASNPVTPPDPIPVIVSDSLREAFAKSYPDIYKKHVAWEARTTKTQHCPATPKYCFICATNLAKITSSSAQKVTTALRAMTAKEEKHPRAPVVDIGYAVVLAKHFCGGGEIKRFYPPVGVGTYDHVTFPSSTSVGVRPGVVDRDFTVDGRKYKIASTGKKFEHEMEVNLELGLKEEAILANYRAGDRTYHPELYDPPISNPSLKRELKGFSEEDKARIIIVVNYLLLKISKKCIGPSFEEMKRKGGIGIGLRWFDGDAQRIYNELRDALLLYDYDISAFDRSLLALVLGLLMASYANDFHEPTTEAERERKFVFEHHLQYLVNSTLIKVAQWFDGAWRVITGMMFSGSYETSMHDTLYQCVVITCWLIQILRTARERGDWKTYEAVRQTMLVWFHKYKSHAESAQYHVAKALLSWLGFGDDGLCGLREIAVKPAPLPTGEHFPPFTYGPDQGLFDKFGLVSCKDYFKECFFLEMKAPNCHTTFKLTSSLNKDGTILRKPAMGFDGKMYDKPEGVSFLKHVFVCFQPKQDGKPYHLAPVYYEDHKPSDDYIIMPYREVADYSWRLAKAPQGLQNPLYVVVRAHAILASTYGMHPKFTSFVKEFVEEYMKKAVAARHVLTSKDLTDLDYEMERMMERFRHSGVVDFADYHVRNFPPLRKVLAKMMSAAMRARADRSTFTAGHREFVGDVEDLGEFVSDPG